MNQVNQEQHFHQYYKNLAENIHIPIIKELDNLFENIENVIPQEMSWEKIPIIPTQPIDDLIYQIKNTLGTNDKDILQSELRDCKKLVWYFNNSDLWSFDMLLNSVFRVYSTYHQVLYGEMLIKPKKYVDIYRISREIFCLDQEQKKYKAPVLYKVRFYQFTHTDLELLSTLKKEVPYNMQSFIEEVRKNFHHHSQNDYELLRESIVFLQAQCWMFIQYMKGEGE